MEEVRIEVDWYIGMPGQALAYNLGQREILQLREESRSRLGPAFDIKGASPTLYSAQEWSPSRCSARSSAPGSRPPEPTLGPAPARPPLLLSQAGERHRVRRLGRIRPAVGGGLIVLLAVFVVAARDGFEFLVVPLFVVALLGLIVAVLWTGTSEDPARHRERARALVFALQMVYLLLLFAGAIWYWQGSKLGVPPHVNLYCFLPNPIGGVPLEIAWFGALGGVLLSLQALVRHVVDWNIRYHPWHVARPFVGAGVAVVAYFLFIVTVRATGTDPNPPGSNAQPTTTTTTSTTTSTTALGVTTTTTLVDDPLDPRQTRRCRSISGPRPAGRPIAPDDHSYIYYAVAFLVGFREETFRRLIRRLSDVVLTPGDEPTAPSSLRIAVEPVKPKEQDINKQLPIKATVTNTSGDVRKGELVRFVVTGAHKLNSLQVTKEDGTASFTYTGEKEGDDTIVVFVDVNGDGQRQADEPQDLAEVTWTKPGTAEPASPPGTVEPDRPQGEEQAAQEAGASEQATAPEAEAAPGSQGESGGSADTAAGSSARAETPKPPWLQRAWSLLRTILLFRPFVRGQGGT